MERIKRSRYLKAMQVLSWVPTQQLPFAPQSFVAQAPSALPLPKGSIVSVDLEQVVVPYVPTRVTQQVARVTVPGTSSIPAPAPAPAPAPRFSLQLYRAGSAVLLVDLPIGEFLQQRDPAFLLLSDIVRAAGLPTTLEPLAEPIQWPLLANQQLDQGPAAARVFVRSVLGAQLEQYAYQCIWLVGMAACSYTTNAPLQDYAETLDVDLGQLWVIPGLESFIEYPEHKRQLWQAMQRSKSLWTC